MPAVVLAPWSAAWPLQFERIRTELLAAFEDAPVRIEHIGSTAVPGLVAKPVIDALLGAETLAVVEARIDALAGSGYRYRPEYEDVLPTRRYFVRDADGERLRIHLHAVAEGDPIWREHLAFRDALRDDAALRTAYRTLKCELAARFADDKTAYGDAKGPFIRDAIDRLLGGSQRPQ
ncbi:MAG: GrpB family protein [Pseudomonadota bacterium]|jgi:GrpB-like predicted nucleotidyltransferase (UPF0157 family)